MTTDAVKQALASFRAAPTDDGRRQVLADALQEAGDPRGEYIAAARLIDAQQHSSTTWHRAELLHRLHYREWTRELDGVFSYVSFKAGFPHGARVETDDSAAIQAAAQTNAGCTLADISVNHPGALPALSHLPSLNSLSVGRWDDQRAPAIAPRLEHLETRTLAGHELPRLLTLRVYGQTGFATALRHAQQLPRLTRLDISCDQKSPLQSWRMALEAWATLPWKRLELRHELSCERQPDGTTHVTLPGRATGVPYLATIAPPSVRRIAIVGRRDPRAEDELRRALPLAEVVFLYP